MEVDLIFKIAAIGILVAVLNQLLIRSGREERRLMVVAGRAGVRADADGPGDQRPVRPHQVPVRFLTWSRSSR